VLRRHVGVVVILVAGVVLVIAAGVQRGRVGGAARLPLGTPATGSCTAWIRPAHPATVGGPVGGPSSAATQLSYPSTSITDCALRHRGLLISIDFSTGWPVLTTLPEIQRRDAACRDAADAWLSARGLAPFDDHRGSTAIGWVPALTVVGRAVGPDSASRAAGASWSGCVLTSLQDDFSAAANPTPTMPGMCLRLRLKSLTALDVSGFTTVSTPPSEIDCNARHPGQLLAFAPTLTGDPSPAQENQSCQMAASRYTGTSDPGFGNSIVTEVVHGNDTLCYAEVTGNRLLDGSLLGVGDGPLPWAS
jgi:hypothetical protein